MSLFATGASGSNQTNDSSKLDFLNEGGTAEIRAFVNSNITSSTVEMDRIVRYQLHWNFYSGKHWRMYNDTFLSFNYIKAFIDKIIRFTLGKEGFGLTVESENGEEVPEDVEKAAEAYCNRIWRKNKKIPKQTEIFQMGSVTGDVWIHLQYKKDSLSKKLELQIQTLDSRHCFPEFNEGDIDDVIGLTIRMPLGQNENKFKIFCTRYTSDTIETWYQKDTKPNKDAVKYGLSTTENPYGFIPVVHMKNKANSEGYFGTSDCSDILKLNKTYNELAQTLKGVIDYYVEPITVITGGTVKQMTRGLGRMWSGLPAEANVFNLGLGEDLNGAMTFMQLIKTNMHEIGDMPENALGKIQAISNTSAAALEITYQPMVQQADAKVAVYSEGLVTLHHMMIIMGKFVEPDDELLKIIPDDFYDTYSVRPVFKYGLPDDEAQELQNAETRLRLGIDTKKNIMNRLGMRNVPKVLKEVDAEKIADAKVTATTDAIQGLNQQPQMP